MPDNLTIQVGLDLSKLKADAILVNQEIRKLTSDVSKSVRAGDTAGAAAATAGLVGTIEKQTALKAAIAGSSAETLTLSKRISDMGRELEHVRGQFSGGLGGVLGGMPITGPALGIGLGVAVAGEAAKFIAETPERAHQMEVMSKTLGVSTGQMRDWTLAAGRAHVPGEIFNQLLERLAISAEKAADVQRKLRVETAQLIAKDDSFGVVARGGLSTPPPKLSSRLVENTLMSPLPGESSRIHDDETAQNRLEMRAAKFREFAKGEFETFKQAQELFTEAGQSRPLPSFDSFERNLRSRMAGNTPEADALNTKFAQQGGVAPARDFSEMLKRLEPDFKDAFTKHNIALIDTRGKLFDFEQVLVSTTVAMSRMGEAEKLEFDKNIFSRQIVKHPEAAEFFSDEGKLGGGILKDAPRRADPDVDILASAAREYASAKASLADDSLTAGGATARTVKAIADSFKTADTDAEGLGASILAIGNESGSLATTEEDAARLDETMRKLARDARAAAAAVGAALGGGAQGFSDAGEGIPGFAQGGLFSGRPGRDTNLAWMTDGEYVINRDSARRIGLSTLNAMNFGRHLPRYASGGAVGSISSGGPLGTVNVTFDGQTHSLRADRENFEGIVQHARTRRMAQIAPRPANAT